MTRVAAKAARALRGVRRGPVVALLLPVLVAACLSLEDPTPSRPPATPPPAVTPSVAVPAFDAVLSTCAIPAKTSAT